LIARGRSGLAFAALLALASCVHFDVYRVLDVDTLYFGTAKSDGTMISEAEWHRFLNDVVAPRLEGFTSWDADGLYHSSSGAVVRERSHVMQIIHQQGHREREIAEIIAAYKKTFAQESVLRVRGRAGVAFQ
jgi:hypothetical protein